MLRVMRTVVFLAFELLWTGPSASAQNAALPARSTEGAVPFVTRESCLGLLDTQTVVRRRNIEVHRTDGSAVTGRLASVSDGAVVLQPEKWGAEEVKIADEEISSVKYWVRGVGDGKSYVGLGAAIGAALGFVLGYALSEPEEPDPNAIIVLSDENQRTVAGFVGILIGGGFGALAGLAASGDPDVAQEINCTPQRGE